MYNRTTKRNVILGIALVLVISIGTSAFLYLQDYYQAGEVVKLSLQSNNNYIVEENADSVVFLPADLDKGIIFYPEARVEYTSYAPLMSKLAANGILCVLLKMPQNIPMFNIDAADGWVNKFPEIKSWYMAGHSMGGAAAAIYATKNIDSFNGVILLGTSATVNMSPTNLQVISIFGSNDEILDQLKYENNKSNLPKDYVEGIIDGGCHCYFGNYGIQVGDGTANITRDTQQQQTVDIILANIK